MTITTKLPRRPRVGIDAHVLDGKRQGSATFLKGILRSLANFDLPFDVKIYVADPDRASTLLGPSPFAWSRLPQTGSASRLLAFPSLFARDGIDLGVFQFIAPPLGRTRSLVVVHDVLPITHPDLFPFEFRVSRRILIGHSIRRASAITTVSQSVRSEILRLFNPAENAVFVAPNGPSFDRDNYFGPTPMRPPSVSADRSYVLAVGRIEKRKNIDLLVQAFRRADLSQIDLVIVGRVDLHFEMEFSTNSNVLHLEGIDDAELAALYRHAALFVFPSRAEGFGIPLLDALLSGSPAIASDQTAMPEIAGGLASLFDPTRADAEEVLACLLRGHFTDTPIRAPTETERRALADRFDWDASANVFVDAVIYGLASGGAR